MTDKQPEALIRADELEAIGAESSLARAMAAHTIRLLYKENEALRARLDGFERVNMSDHKEGDLGIGTKPYAAQAAIVAQQTQGRMRIDPVTGDVGIGTVKSQRGWQGLTEDDAIQLLPVMPYEYDVDVEMILKFAEAIEAKLKEKNSGAG